MSTSDEIRDLLHMFQEIGERFRETDLRFKETDLKWRKTDRQIKESDRKMKESDRKFKDALAETSRLIKEQSRHYAGLSDSVGFFAEGMVKPSIIPLFDQRGIRLDTVTARTEKHLNGDFMEIDLLGIGPKSVVLTEVKFKLETADMAEMLNDMQRFFTFFLIYSGLTLYGAVAGMSIDPSVARFAYHKGLFVLGQTGENIRILNDAKFVPQTFPRTRTRVTRKHRQKK